MSSCRRQWASAVSPDTASCIYAAILADTGGFTSRSTTPETLSTAAELARLGADPARIANDLCFSSPECKVRLLGAALVNMQRQGTIAWSWATLGDLERLQAMAEDCDGVVNYLVGIAGVEAAFFAVELPNPGEYRLSLRSKSQLDVARVCGELRRRRTSRGQRVPDARIARERDRSGPRKGRPGLC